jgi:F-type H+-transporting ATPase subunit b
MTINWWTLGIQTVNVVILVWLLQHFFWRPVAAMIEQRRAAAQKSVSDAEASRTQAAAAMADIEKTRAGFDAEKTKILADAQKAGEAARATVLNDAGKVAAALVATSKVAIEKERADAEKGWADRSSQLAVEIAGRLAKRLDGTQIQTAFLEWLVTAIQAMPALERQAVTANGASLEALSATPLDPAQQERTGALIGKAFGGQPHITFKVDPALIAGLELRGEHIAVSNSWRADLGTILADLTHATRH